MPTRWCRPCIGRRSAAGAGLHTAPAPAFGEPLVSLDHFMDAPAPGPHPQRERDHVGKRTHRLAGSPAGRMVALLRTIVNIDSGSANKLDIDAVGAVVRDFLERHGLMVETLPQSRHGDCLRATIPGQASGNAGGP